VPARPDFQKVPRGSRALVATLAAEAAANTAAQEAMVSGLDAVAASDTRRARHGEASSA
jgi:hypothetical protein